MCDKHDLVLAPNCYDMTKVCDQYRIYRMMVWYGSTTKSKYEIYCKPRHSRNSVIFQVEVCVVMGI